MTKETREYIKLQVQFANYFITTPVWANTVLCPSGSTWTVAYCDEATLNSDSSLIYAFFAFGATYSYGHFITLNVTDGLVIGNRYYSNIPPLLIWDIKISGIYVVVWFKYNSITRFLIYNTSTSSFTNREASSSFNLLSLDIDPNSNR